MAEFDWADLGSTGPDSEALNSRVEAAIARSEEQDLIPQAAVSGSVGPSSRAKAATNHFEEQDLIIWVAVHSLREREVTPMVVRSRSRQKERDSKAETVLPHWKEVDLKPRMGVSHSEDRDLIPRMAQSDWEEQC